MGFVAPSRVPAASRDLLGNLEFEGCQGGDEMGRERSLVPERENSRGFGQLKTPRVQHQIRRIEHGSQKWIFHSAVACSGVEVVSYNPVSGMGEVYSKLVSPACFGLKLQQGSMRRPGNRTISRRGGAP